MIYDEMTKGEKSGKMDIADIPKNNFKRKSFFKSRKRNEKLEAETDLV